MSDYRVDKGQAIDENAGEIDDSASDLTINGNDEYNLGVKGDGKVDKDSPEEIVRRENRMILIIRFVVLLIITLLAIATGVTVYAYTNDSEDSVFLSEFNGIATRIVDALIFDTGLKFWMARTLANNIALGLELSGNSVIEMTIPQLRWMVATHDLKFKARGDFVSWSPLIQSDDDRRTFESHVETQSYVIGAEEPCYLCNGNAKQVFANQDLVFELPQIGSYSCGTIEQIGLQGHLSPENCKDLTQITAAYCECRDIPDDLLMPDNQAESHNISIFRLTEDLGEVAEQYGKSIYLPFYHISVVGLKPMPVLFNQLSEEVRAKAINEMLKVKVPVLSDIFLRQGELYEKYLGRSGEAASVLFVPVFDAAEEEIVGTVSVELLWTEFVTGVLPEYSDLVDVVVHSSCGPQTLTFRYVPQNASFFLRGMGDLHDVMYSDKVMASTFEDYTRSDSVRRLALYFEILRGRNWDVQSQ